jgi:hypothetical protein
VTEPDRATQPPGRELQARHGVDIGRARVGEAGDVARDEVDAGGPHDVDQPPAQ